MNLILKDEIETVFNESGSAGTARFDLPAGRPYVILVGRRERGGKTTTIGKLAHNYTKAGYSVLLGAGRYLPRCRHRSAHCLE